MAKRASKRTWTLGTLDRDVAWTLWFNPVENRWEVDHLVGDAWSTDLDQLRRSSP